MNFKIDKPILDATTHCEYNFECLENKNHFCLQSKINHCVNDAVHFTDCSISCPNYKINFGKSTICFCPTRKEIYNKYNL